MLWRWRFFRLLALALLLGACGGRTGVSGDEGGEEDGSNPALGAYGGRTGVGGHESGGEDSRNTANQACAGTCVACTRDPSCEAGDPVDDNALLASLDVRPATLSPGFEPDTTLYVAVVSPGTLEVTITATTQSTSGRLQINGAEVSSGEPLVVALSSAAATQIVLQVRLSAPFELASAPSLRRSARVRKARLRVRAPGRERAGGLAVGAEAAAEGAGRVLPGCADADRGDGRAKWQERKRVVPA